MIVVITLIILIAIVIIVFAVSIWQFRKREKDLLKYIEI